MTYPADPLIEQLNLNAGAKTAAYTLKAAHPQVIFTSGRRDKDGQASAMASNVVENRTWIQETYRADTASKACQQWVNDNPAADTHAEITAGLCGVLDSLSDSDLAELSKHLGGDAFDVQPIDGAAGDAIKTTIHGLAGLKLFLEKEGGLVRWHAEF